MKSIIVIIALLVSCGSRPPTPYEQDWLDCVGVDINQVVPEVGLTLVGEILQIVEAGSDGWKDALANMFLKYGEKTAACALKAAYDAISQHPVRVSATAANDAADRLKLYTLEHQLQFKGGL